MNTGTRRRCALVAILGLALCLRGYHLTGSILDHDEAHWLFYALDKRALFEKVANSLPRPDVLFPLLLSLPLKLFGPNELGMRMVPALFGALSVLPLAWWVKRETGSETIGLTAAFLLAVQPLHVCVSSLGEPDSISLFFLLAALVFLARHREGGTRTDLAAVGGCLALALLSKGTALYFWVALALMGPKLLKVATNRRDFYIALLAAAAPLVVVTVLIRWRGESLTFLNEAAFDVHNTMVHLARLLALSGTAYTALLIASAWGVVHSARSGWRSGRDDDQHHSGPLIWLMPLTIVLIAAPFRAFARDLVFLIPTICLFAADAVEPVTTPRRLGAGALTVLLLGRALWGIWLPGGLSISAGLPSATGILARPAGWPSHAAARWLLSHTDPADGILITTFSYPDPVQLEVRAERRVGVAWNHWEWLQDPARRVKFVVFVGDVAVHAPYFARYADAHFQRMTAEFAGYTIYDCQRNGRFIACRDAFSSADVYVQRGVLLLQHKQCPEAIGAFETALRVDPDSATARHDLMVACIECGHKEEAVRMGSEILEREPNDPSANVNLAILYLGLGWVDDGLEQCRKNIRLGIAPAVGYGVLGQLLEKKGELHAAADAYAKSLSFDPTNEVTMRLYRNVQTKLREQSGH
ncbi:MAG TPA: glycosyltransferase family 39 protein [Verrucomicrobiae bacterium]|nr:glycosyltransferase family 39 protein [Verrucomicrobiae bacterium]